MPKFIVNRTVHYSLEVEADDEDDALEQAKDVSEEDFAFVEELEFYAEPLDN